MSKIISYLPGQSHSMTAAWMHRKPTQTEVATTFIGVGILATWMGYRFEYGYLTLGATTQLATWSLQREYRAYTPPEESGTPPKSDEPLTSLGKFEETPSLKNSDPLPLRIMEFIVLSAFIGKCVKESWTLSSKSPSTAWIPFLIKIPFHYYAFESMTSSSRDLTGRLGRSMVRWLDKDSSDQTVMMASLATFILAVMTAYVAPRLNYLSGWIVTSSIFPIAMEASIKQSNDMKAIIELSTTASKIVMLICMGGLVGVAFRSRLGPVDYTPSFSKLGQLWYLVILVPYHFVVFAGLVLSRKLNNAEAFLQWVDRTFPQLDMYASAYALFAEKAAGNLEQYKRKSLEEIENILKGWEEKHQLDIDQLRKDHEDMQNGQLKIRIRQQAVGDLRTSLQREPSEKEIDDAFENMYQAKRDALEKQGIKVGSLNITRLALGFAVRFSKDKGQTIEISINEVKGHIKSLLGFYETVTNKKVPEWTPVKLLNTGDKPQMIQELEERLGQVVCPGKEGAEWTQEQAAYILLAPFDKKDPNNQKHIAWQMANFKVLALMVHPDKNGDQKEKAETLFKAVGKARGTLVKLRETTN